jgi:hypothetical protein
LSSHEILAELAETVPAFAVARSGKVPEYGVPIGEAPKRAAADGAAAAPPFVDTWFVPQGAARWR